MKPFIGLVKKHWVGIILCCLTMIILDYLFGTVCFSVILFGIPCPACGMTRAAKLMLTGHFRESFHMHPLLLFVAFGILNCIIIKKILKNYIVIIKLYVIISIVIFIGFYIYRMKMDFPNIEPMVYNENNYLYKIAMLWHKSKLIK